MLPIPQTQPRASPVPHPALEPQSHHPSFHQWEQRRVGLCVGSCLHPAPCRQGPHCISTAVLLPSRQPEQLSPVSVPLRATSCHPQTWPLGCSRANEPHETCPAPHATRVSRGSCCPPLRGHRDTGGWLSGPLCSQLSCLPGLLTRPPAPLLAVMVPLLMRRCLGSRLPLSPQGRCPWSRPCGEWATQHRAR